MLVKYRSRRVRSWASNSGPATVRLCYRATRVERKYAKEFSHALGREMELLHFGSVGRTLPVFRTSQGRLYQWEDFAIVRALAPWTVTGDPNVKESVEVANLLKSKGVDVWLDIWAGWAHDWPYWSEMMRKYLAT